MKILVLVFFAFAIILTGNSIYHIVTTRAPDFSLNYFSARDLIHHVNPYTDPDMFTLHGYPPSTFVLFIPLSLLPYNFAQGIFTFSSFLTIPAIIFISLKTCFKKFGIYTFLIFLSLSMLSFPVKFTLGMGQINLISFFFLILSYFCYRNNKARLSGLILGISFVTKPVFVFFLLFFILKKEWKIVIYSFVIPILTTLIALCFGLFPFIYWINFVIPNLLEITGREVYYNQGIMGFTSRVSGDLLIRKYTTLITSIAVILFTSIWNLKSKNKNLQFSLFIITLLFIDSLSWQHHFVWLIFPFILITSFALKVKKILFWIILLTAFLLISWNFKNPEFFFGFPKSLILSNDFYGAILLYFLNILLLLGLPLLIQGRSRLQS